MAKLQFILEIKLFLRLREGNWDEGVVKESALVFMQTFWPSYIPVYFYILGHLRDLKNSYIQKNRLTIHAFLSCFIFILVYNEIIWKYFLWYWLTKNFQYKAVLQKIFICRQKYEDVFFDCLLTHPTLIKVK